LYVAHLSYCRDTFINGNTSWTREALRSRVRDRRGKKRADRNRAADRLKSRVTDDALSQTGRSGGEGSGRACCECHGPFKVIQIEGVELDFCPECRGFWFDPGELKSMTATDSDVPASKLKHRTSRYKCPICLAQMTEHVYLEPHNLLVDCCPDGHGIYLEEGELERAIQLALKSTG
jgi:Zn-finger nucleic acid-binding protein